MATQAQDPARITSRPTHVRYWMIVFAVTLAVITYIDRVAMSFAAPQVSRDLGLSREQMGIAFSAFVSAYALFEIPSGFLGDWMGPRKVLMRIVIWWSSFTALTGATWNFVSLFCTQALFGAGEAGCFPNLTRAFTTWLPRQERVRAQGFMWLAARWGGAFTPPLVYGIFQLMTWRHAFMSLGVIGVVWAVFFYAWFRDDPHDNTKINAAELELLSANREMAAKHGHVPWGKFVRSRTVWMLCFQYFCLSYGWYFYITWLPTYLQEARGVTIGKSAVLSMLPLFLGGLGSLFCGLVSGPLARRTFSVSATRKMMACIGFTGASLLLVLSIHLANPTAAMVAMGFASFANDLVMPGSWGACMDVGGKFAGTLSGTMNMMGNLGGAVSPTAIGLMLKWTHSNWDITFYVSAAVYFCGSFFWLLMDPVTPLEGAE
ncbi:MAG TPA: MFS transporter [Bryobacteraceae bacterium]|nr:MFS transporter [Bryobacteraceae bacterium]